MPCCGKGRVARPVQRQASHSIPARTATPPLAQSQPFHQNLKPVFFQYTGRSGMTVFGPVTGQRYRFTAPGALVAIDPRDTPSMASVPHLQRITTRPTKP